MIQFQHQGAAFLRQHPGACLVVVTQAKGSTPRAQGAWMLVNPTQQLGTIGGGALEHQVLQLAREAREPFERAFNLGTAMNQCCGGWMRLEFWPAPDLAQLPQLPSGQHWVAPDDHVQLHVHGAGHVSRALADLIAPLPVQLCVIDSRPEYLQQPWPAGVQTCMDTPESRPDAVIIMTHSHELDQQLCQHYLADPPVFLGLLGSHSKAASFASRLRKQGLDPTPIVCPIGDKSLGKEPGVVALSLLHHLLQHRESV